MCVHMYRSIFGVINNLSIRNFRFCQLEAFRFVLFRGREVGMYHEACETCEIEKMRILERDSTLNSKFYTCLARVSWADCNWHTC